LSVINLYSDESVQSKLEDGRVPENVDELGWAIRIVAFAGGVKEFFNCARQTRLKEKILGHWTQPPSS